MVSEPLGIWSMSIQCSITHQDTTQRTRNMYTYTCTYLRIRYMHNIKDKFALRSSFEALWWPSLVFLLEDCSWLHSWTCFAASAGVNPTSFFTWYVFIALDVAEGAASHCKSRKGLSSNSQIVEGGICSRTTWHVFEYLQADSVDHQLVSNILPWSYKASPDSIAKVLSDRSGKLDVFQEIQNDFVVPQR